jgi:hypothetical protein
MQPGGVETRENTAGHSFFPNDMEILKVDLHL